MKTSFVIHIWAVGIYAILTLPAVFIPMMYIISLVYVLIYGWFAWALFTMFYLMTDQFRMNYISKMFILVFGVILSVAFAFQMLEILNVENKVWRSGFLVFPLVGVLAGWISLYVARKQVQADCPGWMEPAEQHDTMEQY
jgi:hypothetical protein